MFYTTIRGAVVSAALPLVLAGCMSSIAVSVACAQEVAGGVAVAAESPALSAESGSTPAAGEDATLPVFTDGVLTFGGVSVTLPEDFDVRVAGTLALGEDASGGLRVAAFDLSMADLPADAQARAAFLAAAQASATEFAEVDVADLGLVDMPDGVTNVYRYRINASTVVGADGKPDSSVAWEFTQNYVQLADGGFSLVQLGCAADATDGERASYEAACESLTLAPSDERHAPEYGFTFTVPKGMDGDDGMLLASDADVMVECLGALAPAPEAAGAQDDAGEDAADAEPALDGESASDPDVELAADPDAEPAAGAEPADDPEPAADREFAAVAPELAESIFSAVEERMGATLEGTETYGAVNATVTVGVYKTTRGASSYEMLLALVPMPDGSVEGLLVLCDPSAAETWGSKLVELVRSIQVL